MQRLESKPEKNSLETKSAVAVRDDHSADVVPLPEGAAHHGWYHSQSPVSSGRHLLVKSWIACGVSYFCLAVGPLAKSLLLQAIS
jgi:hypothetical protein